MKKIFLLIGLLGYLFIGLLPASAQLRNPVGKQGVGVSAQIGQYDLSLSGYIAPFASVVLTSNGKVLASTVADAQGNFSFSQVIINKGFSNFCLDSVDVKRLGDSEACFTVPPASGNITKNNIFLPPTLGLYRNSIQAGSAATVWGYSMPGATVSISLGGKTYSTTADKNGYYQLSIVVDNAGSYQLFASANYQGKNSEKPTKGKTLTVESVPGQIAKNIITWLTNLLKLLFGPPWGPIWFAIPILILIFILLRKLLKQQPQRPAQGLPGVKAEKRLPIFDKLFKSKKLHHWWMKGVGY